MYEDDEGRLDAAEQLAGHNPHAAAEALSAIACDHEFGDEVRLSAAEQLAAIDPRAAGPACLPSPATGRSLTRCVCRPPSSSRPSTTALEPGTRGPIRSCGKPLRAAGPAGDYSVSIQWLRRRAAVDRTFGSCKVLASSALPS